VPRPRLRNLLDWTCGAYAYRAELAELVTTPAVVTGSPVLDRDPGLPDAWWRDLRAASRALAAVPTDREAVRQSWIDRNFRRFVGIDPPRISDRITGHADLHWANLSAPTLIIFDWESWGGMPVGYDPGLLHAYSLTVPAVAARVSSTHPPAGPGNSSPSASSSKPVAGASTPTSPRSLLAGSNTSPKFLSPHPDRNTALDGQEEPVLHPRVDVVVLSMNDRPAEEAAAQATLLAQSDVDVRVVLGNGCRPQVVPPGALTMCLPKNLGIPGGRNAGVTALRDAGDSAEWLSFLDNEASFLRPDVLARLVAAWIQPRAKAGRPGIRSGGFR
jgi:hypothetical protein